MPIVDLVVHSPVPRSMRCRQLESVFDVPAEAERTLRWQGAVPLEERPWQIGLIVGPSGSGKTTVARDLFGDAIATTLDWDKSAVLDNFPAALSLVEITEICRAVGFNTIPAWMRSFGTLSNGEQFRVTLARHLAEARPLLVLDEFSSVVDRQVAQICAFATQRYVRAHATQFVAVTCHSDVEAWLNPDWVLWPETMTFTWRSLQRRPELHAEIAKVHHSAWRLFARYHYMNASLHPAAQCFVLFVEGQPASFTAVLPRPNSHRPEDRIWGGTRAVTLPDWQGLGLTFVLRETLGAAFKACMLRFRMYPSHPTFVRSHQRSPKWRQESALGSFSARAHSGKVKRYEGFGGKHAAVFEYTGPAMSDKGAALRLLALPSLGRETAHA